MTKPPHAFRSGVRDDWISRSFETVSIVTLGAIMPLIATLYHNKQRSLLRCVQIVTSCLTGFMDSRGTQYRRGAIQDDEHARNPLDSLGQLPVS